MAAQVTVVGILMIVQGSLACVLGVLLAFGGVFLSAIGLDMPGGPPEARDVFTFLSIVYFALGMFAFAGGILNIFGGVKALRYRGRGFVLTALFFNIATIFTVYCAPTSIGLLIYGLIVMFNAEVVSAFNLGEQGMPPEEIKRRFTYYRPRYRRDEDYDEDYRREEPEPRQPPPPSDQGDTRYYER